MALTKELRKANAVLGVINRYLNNIDLDTFLKNSNITVENWQKTKDNVKLELLQAYKKKHNIKLANSNNNNKSTEKQIESSEKLNVELLLELLPEEQENEDNTIKAIRKYAKASRLKEDINKLKEDILTKEKEYNTLISEAKELKSKL